VHRKKLPLWPDHFDFHFLVHDATAITEAVIRQNDLEEYFGCTEAQYKKLTEPEQSELVDKVQTLIDQKTWSIKLKIHPQVSVRDVTHANIHLCSMAHARCSSPLLSLALAPLPVVCFESCLPPKSKPTLTLHWSSGREPEIINMQPTTKEEQ
jgi:hypothetical protein